jgi:hypothetical protein
MDRFAKKYIPLYVGALGAWLALCQWLDLPQIVSSIGAGALLIALCITLAFKRNQPLAWGGSLIMAIGCLGLLWPTLTTWLNVNPFHMLLVGVGLLAIEGSK